MHKIDVPLNSGLTHQQWLRVSGNEKETCTRKY